MLLRKSSSSDTYSSNLSGHDDGFSHIVKKSVVSHRSVSINNTSSGSTAKDIAGYPPTTRGAWSGMRSKSCGMGSSTPLVGRKVSLPVAMARWTGQVLCNLVRLQIGSSPIKTYRQIRGELPVSHCSMYLCVLRAFLCPVRCHMLCNASQYAAQFQNFINTRIAPLCACDILCLQHNMLWIFQACF